MKTLIVGLGNPALGDDGVGWKVVKEVCKSLPSPRLRHPSPARTERSENEVEAGRGDGGEGDLQVNCLTLGGMGLMEHLIGYDRAILVDAFATDAPVGSISVLKLGQLPNYSAYHITSAHDTSLQEAIEMGREMGAHLPGDVMVVGIATERIHEFSEELSPSVEQVIPCVVKIVLDLINEFSTEESSLT